jgi:7-keto-8-aminopelargonate synthetase-like enzyme
MFHLQHTPGRTAIINGKEHLFFSGYSYLGMGHVPEFVELIKEGIDKYGLMFPSSRISNTRLDLFEQFENKLSEITGMEATVCFSSGFLAGRAVIDIFKNEHISCAPQSHPAICLERNQIQGFDEWTQCIGAMSAVLFDSVNPLTAEVTDTSFINSINRQITCIIDDSHGAGLLNNGSGIRSSLPKKGKTYYILTYSLSKAYNIIGGAVSCSKDIAEQLRKSAFYTASTSISPAYAYAFINGQALYDQQREKLRNNIVKFNTLTKNQLKSHPDLPIFILADVNEKKLEEAGIIISSFAYPDPNGKKINRVVLNALHTEEDLQSLAEALM